MSSQNDLVSLTISLPDDRQVEMDVDSETPMMDLLVQIACKYGLSPSGVALRVPSERSSGYIRYQPSTPVGRLDSCRIEIVDRAQLANRPSRPSHRRPSGLPFEPTQRIQIDLGRYQKTFVRISTAATVAELVDEVCKQQILNRRRYRIRAAAAPHVALDEKLPIREVGTTVFTLVPIDGFDKRAESSDDILGEIEKMPAEEKEKKKKKGFFSLFKSSKSSKSKSPPTHEAKGVAVNGVVNAEVPRSRQVPEVVITDERRRGESNLSQASSRKKRAAPQPPEPATATVTTVEEVASDRQSRRNSDSSSGYHESCASPTEDCSSSLEKRPIDVTLAGKKKTRAPSPPPAATTHQDELLSDEHDIATAFDEAIFAGQATMSTATVNGMPKAEIDLNDIMPLPAVALVRTPTPEREPAEPAKIAASPPPPSPTPSVEPQPQSVLSAPLAEVLSESLAQTTTSPAVADSIPRESKPVIAISSPPPAPPPPPTLILPKTDKLESNISTVTLRTSPVLQRPQQLLVEMPSPTDLSSQIAREAAETLHKLSPIGQRRFFPTAQRHSNITLNERQKDSPPAIRVASFEEEYAVKQYEHRLNSPLGNESDAFASVSLNNSVSSAAEDASEERLQKEYDALRAMFDEWQVLSGRLEMRGTADPSISNRLRQLQRELAQQHQTVQRLCAVVQTDAARATKNVRIDSGTERSGSSQSSFGTANSSHHSPSPPPALVPELPKSIAHTNQSNDKFFVKETTEVLSASKQPTGGSSAYEPKMHLDNGSSHPVNTPLRPKTASAPQKRPISVHGTAFAMKNVTTANGHDLGHAFRQTKHPSTEDLVVTTGVVKPSMLFGERKQNTSAARTTQSVRPSESTAPHARHTAPVVSAMKKSDATNGQMSSPAPKTNKIERPVEVEKVAEKVAEKVVEKERLRPVDPVPNGNGGFAWPELRKVGPPVEKNGIELGSVVTSPKTDTISRNYTVAEASKRQSLPPQAFSSAKSSTANGSASKQNTASVQPSTAPSSKTPVANGEPVVVVLNVPPPPPPPPPPPAPASPPSTEPSSKTPATNGESLAINSNAPPPPPPVINLNHMMKQMGQVNLKPASDRKLKPSAATAARTPEGRDDLLLAIRNAGGIGSLKKVKAVA